MKRTVSTLFLTFTVLVLASCAPRGESVTIDQLVTNAKDAFSQSQASAKTSAQADAVVSLQGELETSLAVAADKSAETPKVLASVGSSLNSLLPHAGVTARPALTELVKQYRELGHQKADQISPSQVKLIVARTYFLLAGELKTTNFSS